MAGAIYILKKTFAVPALTMCQGARHLVRIQIMPFQHSDERQAQPVFFRQHTPIF
jgi:hypothetical protein